MIKILLFHWQPGSCGDTVQHLLSIGGNFITVAQNFQLDQQGRTTRSMDPWFIKNFPHQSHNWYVRDWTTQDIATLEKFPIPDECTTLIIPSHRIDQIRWLKKNLTNSTSLGINYPGNMQYCVLSNWCHKVAHGHPSVKKYYQDCWHQKLLSDELLGAQVLKDQLSFGSQIPSDVQPEFDINLSLESLLLGDISVLNLLGLDFALIESFFHAWISRQKLLYRFRWPIDKRLQQAVGYNSNAPVNPNLDIELDVYDRILIRHWCDTNHRPALPASFTTLAKANEFFKNLSDTPYINHKQ